MNIKLGFIGAGNMGGAIIKCLCKSDFDSDIYVARKNAEALNSMAKELGIKPCKDNIEAAEKDILFMAVKPNMFADVIDEIKDTVKVKNTLIVSMAAGLTTESIRDMFGFDVRIIRIMPNINAEIAQSTTAICRNNLADDKDLQLVKKIMDYAGSVIDVPESQFAVFSAIAGCSPAYVYLFIDSLAKGAQKMGMQKKLALKVAASAVLGSSAMYAESDKHPWELIDKVCSPGGTTIEGVCTLEEYKFESAVVKAVENSVLKDYALNKK